MTPSFLTGSSKREIQRLLKTRGLKRLAVAYWGTGAIKELGLRKIADKSAVRIICDLFSGACNPTEMLKLHRSGYRFKTLEKLHSKVYCSSNAVIIGSSNASSNGLAFGAVDLSGNIEANISIHDKAFCSDCRQVV